MILPKYYYIIGTKNYLLKQEPIEESLRERSNYYLKKRKNIDFWIIENISKINPSLINLNNKENKNYDILEDPNKYLMILSTNKSFIDWLKLRFDNTFKGKIKNSINLIKI